MSLSEQSGKCPSCWSELRSKWGQRDNHDIYECRQCELVYFDRPIKGYDYQEYYPYLADFDRKRFDWEIGVRRRKFKTQLGRIRELMPEAKHLLDVGAGPGYYCAVANENGFSARGVELSDAARAAGEREFGVSYTQLDEVPDDSLDVITCHHVLEHIEWPSEFLATFRRKLRLGGLLILHVPNQQPLSFLMRQKINRRSEDTSCSLYYPIHINGFTTKSLKHVVQRHTFASISIFNVSMWSTYYDPFFLANFYREEQSPITATSLAVKHAARCAVDVAGNTFDRGDWVVGHFRAVSSLAAAA